MKKPTRFTQSREVVTKDTYKGEETFEVYSGRPIEHRTGDSHKPHCTEWRTIWEGFCCKNKKMEQVYIVRYSGKAGLT